MSMTRDRVAAAYDDYYDVMRYIAAQRFRVPAADVRPLIHDVFVAFIRHHDSVVDDRAWLIRATANACLNYWRDRKPAEPLCDMIDSREIVASATARVDVSRLLARVSSRCRTVLWLRYVDGLSPEQIAQRCAQPSSSGHYGRTLVHRCLRSVREQIRSAAARPK
jgi:RNA polymerase sigma factor (sigma-70 family)